MARKEPLRPWGVGRPLSVSERNASPMSLRGCCQNVASRFRVVSYHTGIIGFREAGELGFEPRQADPESAVLPLHHSPKARRLCLGKRSPITSPDVIIVIGNGQVILSCGRGNAQSYQ